MSSVFSTFSKIKKTTITHSQEYVIMKISRPKELINKNDLVYLSDVIRRAKSHIFTKEYTENQNIYETIISSDRMIVVFFKKRLIACGFSNIYKSFDLTLLFSAFVRKTYQGKHIGELLMKAAIETKYFVFLTQTPRSYLLLQRIAKNKTLYPNKEIPHLPDVFLKKFTPFIKTLPGPYSSKNSIVLLKSGYSSFLNMPLSKNKSINDWMFDSLYRNRKSGEEQLFLCLGEIQKE